MATTVTTQHVTTPPQVVTQVAGPVVQMAPEAPHPATAKKGAFLTLGIIQLCVGILSIILSGACIGLYQYAYYAGYGIWSGAWYIASGSLAVATSARANSCNVIAGLVVSILACLTAFGVGIAEGILAAVPWCYDYYGYNFSCLAPSAYIGLHGTLAFLAFVQFITAIVHSAYCCSGTCGTGNRQGRVITATTTYVNTQAIPMQHGYVQQQYYPQPPMQQPSFQTQGPMAQTQQPPMQQAQQPSFQTQQPMAQTQQPQIYPSYPPQQQQQMAPPPSYNQPYDVAEKRAM